jgi:uncharacterized protein (TIGR03000 family)
LTPFSSPLSAPQGFTQGYSVEGRNAGVSLLDQGSVSRTDNRAQIWLRAPADAEVWFEGVKTKQTGALRHYFSPPLAAGQKYAYQVRVRWSKDGKPVERKQQIDVRAGDELRLDLSMAPAERNSMIPGAEQSTRPQAGK